ILLIQKWWRMVMYGFVGRKEFVIRRRRLRRVYRAHKKEDVNLRSKWPYRWRDFLGIAPSLQTDTREETVLRGLAFPERQRAREYIWNNVADWGFYIYAQRMSDAPARAKEQEQESALNSNNSLSSPSSPNRRFSVSHSPGMMIDRSLSSKIDTISGKFSDDEG